MTKNAARTVRPAKRNVCTAKESIEALELQETENYESDREWMTEERRIKPQLNA